MLSANASRSSEKPVNPRVALVANALGCKLQMLHRRALQAPTWRHDTTPSVMIVLTCYQGVLDQQQATDPS